jgi:putative endonuclease
MAFWAYLLRCSDGSFYTGHTEALEHRIGQHQSGQIPGYTHTRRPVTLVWSQDFPSRLEALEAERQIKGWSRAKKQALIAGDWERLSLLARNRQAQGERNWRAMSPVPFALSLSKRPHYPRTIND